MTQDSKLKDIRLNKKRGEIVYQIYRANYKEFNVKELAQIFNVSEKSFYRIIKEHRERDWAYRNPEMKKSGDILREAVKNGKIERPKKCEICGGGNGSIVISGHHEDYSKPLEVIWVCNSCHKQLHSKKRHGQRLKKIKVALKPINQILKNIK